MTDYDPFATTFSRSRQNLVWQEIDELLTIVRGALDDLPTPRTLDVGCGNGRLVPYLERYRLAYDYLGIDRSRGMLREAHALYPGYRFEECDMRDLPRLHFSKASHTQGIRDMHDGYQASETFDVIIFLASLHHLDTPESRLAALADAHTLLRNGGYVCLTNWYLAGALNHAKYAKCEYAPGEFRIKIGRNERYYHAFTPEELESLAETAGYTTLENRISDGERNIVTILQW